MRTIIFLSIFLNIFSCNKQKAPENPPVAEVEKEQLEPMNRTKSAFFMDTTNTQKGKEFRVLIIGNSIAYHGKAPQIGWNHVSGMAASHANKDYESLLFAKIESKLPGRKISQRTANLADWERNEMNPAKLDTLISFNPDVVIFQLGENVTYSPDFGSKYESLVNRFKGIKIICTPFIPSDNERKIKAIQQAGQNTGAKIADLAALTDPKNFAKNDNPLPEWNHPGIGNHPGDKGMANIADTIFRVLDIK